MAIELKNDSKVKPYELSVERKFNHYIWMLAFVVASVSIGFLALTLTYYFSKNWGNETINLTIPSIFYVDTVILLLGSFSLWQASVSFKKDKTLEYKIWLYVALLAGLSFLFGQLAGWFALSQTGFGIAENSSQSFLYIILVVHALHIIGGIVFTGILFFNANTRLREPALSVVYFTDPLPKARLKLLNYYWHFLGALWLYLLIFFSIVK